MSQQPLLRIDPRCCDAKPEWFKYVPPWLQSEEDVKMKGDEKTKELTTFHVAGRCLNDLMYWDWLLWIWTLIMPLISHLSVSRQKDKVFADPEPYFLLVSAAVVMALTWQECVALRRIILCYSQVNNGSNIPFKLLGFKVKCGVWFWTTMIMTLLAKCELPLSSIFLSRFISTAECSSWRNIEKAWSDYFDNPVARNWFPNLIEHPIGVFMVAWACIFIRFFYAHYYDAPPWPFRRTDLEYVWKGEKGGYSTIADHIEFRWLFSGPRRLVYKTFFWNLVLSARTSAVFTITNSEYQFQQIKDVEQQLQQELRNKRGTSGVSFVTGCTKRIIDLHVLQDVTGTHADLRLTSLLCDPSDLREALLEALQATLGTDFSPFLIPAAKRSAWHADVLRVKSFANRMLLLNTGNLAWTTARAEQKFREKMDSNDLDDMVHIFSMLEKECQRSLHKTLVTLCEKGFMMEIQTTICGISSQLIYQKQQEQKNTSQEKYDWLMFSTLALIWLFYTKSILDSFTSVHRLKATISKIKREGSEEFESRTDSLREAEKFRSLEGWFFIMTCILWLHSTVKWLTAFDCRPGLVSAGTSAGCVAWLHWLHF